MKTAKFILKSSEDISSATTKELISIAAANIKGKELFAKKVEAAKKSLKDLKSLPL